MRRRPLEALGSAFVIDELRFLLAGTIQLKKGSRPSRSLPSASRRWFPRAAKPTIWCVVFALGLVGGTPTSAGETPAIPENN
jgi:hypothetical protein